MPWVWPNRAGILDDTLRAMALPVIMTWVLASRRLSDTVFELRLQRPTGFEFVSGQRLRVHCQDAQRDYSIASDPADDHLMLCMRCFPQGEISPLLAALTPGARLGISGPYGHFRYQSTDSPAVFVATGTGIAPFRSMAAGIGGTGELLVLHGIRSATDQFYRAHFQKASVRYVACVSGGGGAECEQTYPGRVTEYMQRRLPSGRYDFYLCGRQDMIRDAIHIVDDQFGASRIFTEAFY